MRGAKFYSLETTAREADLTIFGDITSWPWRDSDVASYNIHKELQELDVDVINVHINSYGGEVAEGLAIYNSLRNHSAKVVTYCDGFACSIASVIFMAGDERIMNEASLLMIHNAWTHGQGNAEELRKMAEDLDKITQQSKTIYLSKTNISADELNELMDNESWIDPSEAVEMGFATQIGTSEQSGNPSQSARQLIMDKLRAKAIQSEEVVVMTKKELAELICQLVRSDIEPEQSEEPEGEDLEGENIEEPEAPVQQNAWASYFNK